MTDNSHHMMLPVTVSAAIATESTNGISAKFVEDSDYSTTAAADITYVNNRLR